MSERYVIEFRFPEGTAYAGEYQDGANVGLGIAPTLATAKVWDDPLVAGRMAANHYGPSMHQYAHVLQLDDDGEPVETAA